jgi:ABC-type glycerol-3-phosphate transport system substrate-binding protein
MPRTSLHIANIARAALAIPALAALTGCPRPTSVTADPSKALTPEQYQLLSEKEQIAYKNVVIRVPHTLYGVILPSSRGAYPSTLDKTIHSGDTLTMMGLYNQTLFELMNPRVKVEYLNFDMWSENFNSVLAVALSSGKAPSYYVARNLPQTIEQGMFADITDLMKSWDQFDRQPEAALHEGKVNGRIYTMGKAELSALVIRYRKDWFREAGIFNEFGEPGPRTDWTWEDFRKIAKKLTDPSKNRFGFAGETGDFLYNQAYGIDPLFIPDPTGKHTWVFNDQDPELLRSLQAAREMNNVDKSILTSVSMGWWEWHREFDASHAAMVISWAAHPPRESMEQPYKFGKDKPFRDVVGMVPPPRGPMGLSGLKPITDLLGFDPTLTPTQLKAAFDWVKETNYGELFQNRIHNASLEAQIKGRRSTLYSEMLAMPYLPAQNPLKEPFDKVFPPDYLRTYEAIKRSHYPPLPREFGLKEPPTDDLHGAVNSMYSEAINTNTDLKQIVAKTANIVNSNMLNFKGTDDKQRLAQYIAALTAFYQKNFPRYYETEWRRKLNTYYRVP